MHNMVLWGIVGVVLAFALAWTLHRRKGKEQPSVVVLPADRPRHLARPSAETVNPRSRVKQTKAQRRRRSSAISCYVGYNGSAKSATMVRDTLPDLAEGRPVLSTVPLLAQNRAATAEEADQVWAALAASVGVEELPRPLDSLRLPHSCWIPFVDFRQLLSLRDGVCLMDEVQGIADSREHSSLPVQVANMLFQLRRNGVVLRWTTIDYSAADKRLRRATQTVTYCKGFLPKWQPDRVWPTKRAFWIRTYDGHGFDDFAQAHRRQDEERRPRALAREWCLLRGKRLAAALDGYDSEAAVLTLGAATEAGLCMACGGRRSAPRCSCSDAGGAEPGRGRRSARKRSEDTEPTPTGSAQPATDPTTDADAA